MAIQAKKILEVNGEWLTAKEVGHRFNISYSTIRARLCEGYSVIEVLLKPTTWLYCPVDRVIDRINWWRVAGVAYDVEGYRKEHALWLRADILTKDEVSIHQKFTRLTVKDLIKLEYGHTSMKWLCSCTCGNSLSASTDQLMRGITKSCGCWHKDRFKRLARKHGLSNHPFYGNYMGMMYRCFSTTEKNYKNYGGRGITVCEEWANPKTGMLNFLKWAELQPNWLDNLTVERNNVNGNYEPSNCRLITKGEQAYNRRNSLRVEINGENMHIKEALRRYNPQISTDIARNRITTLGFTMVEALFLPPRFCKYLSLYNVKRNIKDWIAREYRLGHCNAEGLPRASERWLTDDQVQEIRYRYKILRESSKALALEFNVDQKTITNIGNKKTHANVPDRN